MKGPAPVHQEYPKPRLVVLSRDSQEYKFVEVEMQKYMLKERCNLEIDFIERVENIPLTVLATEGGGDVRLTAMHAGKVPCSGCLAQETQQQVEFDLQRIRRGEEYCQEHLQERLSAQCLAGGQRTFRALEWRDAEGEDGSDMTPIETPQFCNSFMLLVCEVAVGMMMETPASAGAQDASVFKDMDVEAIRRAGFDSIRVFDGEAANQQVPPPEQKIPPPPPPPPCRRLSAPSMSPTRRRPCDEDEGGGGETFTETRAQGVGEESQGSRCASKR
eukprot:659676-Hanusia_phi.AAC.6